METVEDVIREMRVLAARVDLWDGDVETAYIRDYADRIEKAYNHQRRDGSLCTMSCRESGELLNQYMEENKRLHEENKRLRAENERLKVCKDFLYT